MIRSESREILELGFKLNFEIFRMRKVVQLIRIVHSDKEYHLRLSVNSCYARWVDHNYPKTQEAPSGKMPPVEVPVELLSQEALLAVLESFIVREGTEKSRI